MTGILYNQQNDDLIWDILNRYHFKGWKEDTPNFNKLELMINYKCNLSCKYCYVNRYGKELYPKDVWQDEDVILENLEIVLRFLKENEYYPQIEIFSGEVLVQEIGLRVLRRVIDHCEGTRSWIMVPTNFTWFLSDNKIKKIEELLEYAKSKDVKVILSASIDGKYCEINRPFRAAVDSGKKIGAVWKWEYNDFVDPRDDEYYDKLFDWAAKYHVGMHPMVYSENIDKWKQNFLWFQKQFERTGRGWKGLYLLEVRNLEWTDDQLLHYMSFIKFLYHWSWERCNKDYTSFTKFLFQGKGFNILTNPLSTVGRGLGCSIQATVPIRLGDLAIPLCHRTSYDHLLVGKLRVEDGKIVGINARSTELYIAMLSLTAKNQPYCETCMIAPLCTFGCLGSQYETTGDLFTPIPTVCKMYFAKVIATIGVLKELGMYQRIIGIINPEKRTAFMAVEQALREG